MTRKRPRKQQGSSDDVSFNRPSPSSKLPLQHKIVAISASIEPSASVGTNLAAASTDEQPCNYQTLRRMAESLGATASAQVHKRVYCLVASECAIKERGTQRVRKAAKLHIPVVSVTWLEACRDCQELIGLDDHIVSAETATFECAAKKQRTALQCKSSHSDTSIKEEPAMPGMEGRKLHLGCCCLCHDTGAPETVTDCPWCTDCNVNVRIRQTKRNS